MVPPWKYKRAFSPVIPTLRRSATLAMPPTIVRRMMGPMSIRIAATKVVPIGSIDWASEGFVAPRTIPTTIATMTQK